MSQKMEPFTTPIDQSDELPAEAYRVQATFLRQHADSNLNKHESRRGIRIAAVSLLLPSF
jgi:hypothetical protein